MITTSVGFGCAQMVSMFGEFFMSSGWLKPTHLVAPGNSPIFQGATATSGFLRQSVPKIRFRTVHVSGAFSSNFTGHFLWDFNKPKSWYNWVLRRSVVLWMAMDSLLSTWWLRSASRVGGYISSPEVTY